MHSSSGVFPIRTLLVGIVIGVAIGWGAALVLAGEPSVTIYNGVLKGWVVTRDDESLVCSNPMIFIRAKQIECE